MTVYYHDLFAGPGGWDVAADALGWVGVGFELDGPACLSTFVPEGIRHASQ